MQQFDTYREVTDCFFIGEPLPDLFLLQVQVLYRLLGVIASPVVVWHMTVVIFMRGAIQLPS